ncbi:MAG: asparagine synthase (glutamine-hydrolyzing) [Leptolyngbyaceae cyanobacterium RU_5_1]|nr:asparagine synthase (glutamine-hydrolyzing) [Leptolyngbyaceae cyanobacterium RU_5_1]
MCGIAGIVTAMANSDRLDVLIERMQQRLHHRGPDDAGIFIAHDRTAALAHTRLAILDLTSAGHQPMSTPDGRFWITFNGEIYNFQALRSQLIAQGEIFQSQTDTEVLLKLYQRTGVECVQHLRGMFAFAIWDDWEKTCFLARDPLGIKPLYYWRSGSTLVFGSELRAVLASGLPEKCLSASGLYGYLTRGSVPEPDTLIPNVFMLEAGHYLFWKAADLKQNQYWSISLGADHPSSTPFLNDDAQATTLVRQALLDSIHHHFMSDVPVGVFLSGGIDSTALVALSRQLKTGELRTYSIAFAEAEWDETDIAHKVAQHFGTDHTEHTVTAEFARILLPKFLSTLDQPSIDGFNTFCVSHIARLHGTKVVLSGLGGDELFGGYRSFQTVPDMVRWGQKIQYLPFFGKALGMGLESWSHSAQLRRLGDYLQQNPSVPAAYQSFRGIFSHREARAIARHYLPDALPPNRFCPDPTLASMNPVDAVSLLELSRYMRNQLLRDGDGRSMVWGLELRVPFVDRELLEAIAPIPAHLRLAPGKQLLVQAIPELPDWVVKRPKQGFCIPYERWLKNEWQDIVEPVTCPVNIPLSPWYRRWSLVVLQQWWSQILA